MVRRRTVLGSIAGMTAIAGCIGDDDAADDDPVADDADDEPDTDDDAADDDPVADDADDEPDTGDDTDDEPADATVQLYDHPEYGEILVGPDRLTLYMFDPDEQGAGESACYDDCADAWPPLVVDDDPVADEGVTAELTTFERDDNGTQVSANGWPLYYWAADAEEGDVLGQGVNDVWWVLTPAGEPIREETDEDDDDGYDDDDEYDDDGYDDDNGYDDNDEYDDDDDDGTGGYGGGY